MKKEIFEKIINSRSNALVSGSISSGKTTNILLPIVDELMERKESFFFIDSKEEYINKYYDKLKENDYNIIILNLRDLDKSESWNPFKYPYELYKNGEHDKAQEYLEKIGSILFYESSKNADPFWSMTSSDFITGIALGLFEDGKINEINFNSINSMFNGIDVKIGSSDYIKEYFNLKGKLSSAYIHASTTFLAPRDTRDSILSVVRQRLRLYVTREKLSKLMADTTFKYEDILAKPTAIFFIGKDESKYMNSLIAMFVDQLFGYLLDSKNKNRFNFILDNLDSVEIINNLSDMMSSGISRNIKFFIGTRSIENLKEKYGDYIVKLADIIEIKNTEITLNINGELNSEPKEFSDVVINDAEIEYPQLKNTDIELFDLISFVISKKGKQHLDSKLNDVLHSNNSKNETTDLVSS